MASYFIRIVFRVVLLCALLGPALAQQYKWVDKVDAPTIRIANRKGIGGKPQSSRRRLPAGHRNPSIGRPRTPNSGAGRLNKSSAPLPHRKRRMPVPRLDSAQPSGPAQRATRRTGSIAMASTSTIRTKNAPPASRKPNKPSGTIALPEHGASRRRLPDSSVDSPGRQGTYRSRSRLASAAR